MTGAGQFEKNGWTGVEASADQWGTFALTFSDQAVRLAKPSIPLVLISSSPQSSQVSPRAWFSRRRRHSPPSNELLQKSTHCANSGKRRLLLLSSREKLVLCPFDRAPLDRIAWFVPVPALLLCGAAGSGRTSVAKEVVGQLERDPNLYSCKYSYAKSIFHLISL